MILVKNCPFCGGLHELEVDAEDYAKWQAGALVQNAFPTLSADERELIMTGICPGCWPKEDES